MTVLKFALIGCGKVAIKHLKAVQYHHRDLQLTALVDTQPAAAAALAGQMRLFGARRSRDPGLF